MKKIAAILGFAALVSVNVASAYAEPVSVNIYTSPDTPIALQVFTDTTLEAPLAHAINAPFVACYAQPTTAHPDPFCIPVMPGETLSMRGQDLTALADGIAQQCSDIPTSRTANLETCWGVQDR